jgi:hypothetical protein
MRFPNRLLLLTGVLCAHATARTFTYHIVGDEPSAWSKILTSIGLAESKGRPADIYVIPAGVDPKPGPAWDELLDRGALLVLEGESQLASTFGFQPGEKRVSVRSVLEARRPKLPIVWQHGVDVPVWNVPSTARVFATDRWSRAPLVAGLKRGRGGVLWLAIPPGTEGYERFPYLLHALVDLGLKPPFRSGRLWSFLDSSYRTRADVDFLAERWRRAGIGALHVAAWHFWEPDAERDAWLDRLIEACHRRTIGVYAWIELPHVSEQFWNAHPEWREKTALLQDAHLDWRKLMNLADRDCYRAVALGAKSLLTRFDWDGVNLAELYFESLEGAANPSRFTPFNMNVRREFEKTGGVDPVRLFTDSQHSLGAFLDFRAGLAQRMQEEWIAELEAIRRDKPDLDLVLTHVDDRFDTRMRELIGADASRLLPLLDRHEFTFLIEDPATIWNLGPQRYTEIAKRYQPLTPHADKLAIDINIVERYQDVYPTKQQTGTELYQQVSAAALAFPRVTLYFEHSILPDDVALLSSAASAVTRVERDGSRLVVESLYGAGVPWTGEALVDGRPWPATDGATVWLPAGRHTIESSAVKPPIRLLDFNGDLRTAGVTRGAMQFSYRSSGRVLARVDVKPTRIEIDGAEARPKSLAAEPGLVLELPRGQHIVTLRID